MHAKPDLRVFLKWMVTRSGSVITDVIRLTKEDPTRYLLRQTLYAETSNKPPAHRLWNHVLFGLRHTPSHPKLWLRRNPPD